MTDQEVTRKKVINPDMFYSRDKPQSLDGFVYEPDSDEEVYYCLRQHVPDYIVVPPSPPRTSYSPTNLVSTNELTTEIKKGTIVEYSSHSIKVSHLTESPINHLPTYGETRKRCVRCKGLSKFFCPTCDQYFCLRGSKNCFLEHHKAQVDELTEEDRNHLPVVRETRQRCDLCPTNEGFSKIFCFLCNMYLCLRGSKNCYTKHHETINCHSKKQ